MCRILGLIGSAASLLLVVYYAVEYFALPYREHKMSLHEDLWWILIFVSLVIFNFVPLPMSKESWIGLWELLV